MPRKSPSAPPPVTGGAFELLGAEELQRRGWRVQALPATVSLCQLVLTREHMKVAVQVKDLKTAVSEAKVRQFAGFMAGEHGHSFDEGWVVSRNGFSRGALGYIESNSQLRIKAIVAHAGFMGQVAGASPVEQRRIGVFTFKGGVGKSKVALILAGALAYRDGNVFVVDLNRAQNLQHLIGDEGLLVDRGGGSGGTVSVLGREEWKARKDEWRYGPVLDADYVVYDCPQFFEKPAERSFLPHLDVVLSPLLLNADSSSVGHHVLRDTVAEVRRDNAQAPIAFLVNNLRREQRQGPMKAFLRSATDLLDGSQNVHLLPIDQFAIPYHRTLEELGQQHAFNPRSAVELIFARPRKDDLSWLRPIVRLADVVIKGDFWH